MGTNYLMHHGIKGQKWGIRRFQNEDGSLTELGRSRYGSQEASYKKAADEAYSAYRSGNKVKVQEIGEKLVQDWAKSTGKDAFDFIQEHIDKMDDERGNADDLTYLMNEVIPDKYWVDFYEKYFNAKHGGNMSDGNYLAHHGIKGQKWGIRRFQNPDGSLTELGKRRYGTVENFNRAMEKKASRKRIAAKVGIGAAATAGAIAGMHEIGRRKNEGSGLFNPTIKGGKDKPNKSPAEKITSDASKTVSEVSRAVDTVHRIRSRDDNRSDPSVSSMSDAELRRAINRINLEKQYASLTRKETSDGYQKVKDILDVISPVVGVTAGVVGIVSTVNGLKVKHDDSSMRFDYDNYLMHHGIRGQKWGVRRFQNEDGSYTQAGRARYDMGDYKKGLRNATLTGGLVGRAIYKKKHANEATQLEKEKAQRKDLAKEKKDKGGKPSDEYSKGLRNATLTGGLVGRAMYKKQHSESSGNSSNQKVSSKQLQSANEGKRMISKQMRNTALKGLAKHAAISAGSMATYALLKKVGQDDIAMGVAIGSASLHISNSISTGAKLGSQAKAYREYNKTIKRARK